MDLLNTKMLSETDFFKIWDWINRLNAHTDENPHYYHSWKNFYTENMDAFNSNEKLQDIINITKTKSSFYHNGKDMTQEMIQSFNEEKNINSSIRLAVEDNIRFNSKIFSKLIQQNYSIKKEFDFNFIIRQSLKFTDFSIKDQEIQLNRFRDVNIYKRQEFILEADQDLNIAAKLKRYGFPHQSFYNFIDDKNKSIPRKKFLVQLSYFFQFNFDMMESLMNQYGYTVKLSNLLLDEIIKHSFVMGVSFENLKNITSFHGYNF
ncbi:MAG: hypothetical protein MJA31_14045 [Clostridia bacterium]|nr:hypothetical protein [Clostridia bacterium]